MVIYDNLKKKIHYIENVYGDSKIKDYEETYNSILKKFDLYTKRDDSSGPKGEPLLINV